MKNIIYYELFEWEKEKIKVFHKEQFPGMVRGLKYINADESRKSVNVLRNLIATKKITLDDAEQSAYIILHRAKLHKHATKSIKEAEKVWEVFLKEIELLKKSE